MTKVVGVLIILCALVYLGVTLVDFTPKYGAVPAINQNQDQLDITTSTTNLRFHIALPLVLDIIIIGLLGIVSWHLITSETQQYAYAVALAVLIVASVVIRLTPIVPYTTARVSPGAFFFGSRVIVSVAADTTSGWVIIPPRENQRVAVTEVYTDTSLIGSKEIALDFSKSQSALQQYLKSQPPVSLLGSMNGTRVLAVGKDLYTVPCVKVFQVQQAGQ